MGNGVGGGARPRSKKAGDNTLLAGDRVTGISVQDLSVGDKIGEYETRGNPNTHSTFMKFSVCSLLIVTSVVEQLGECHPRTKMLLTLLMNDSSIIPPSTNCVRLDI